MVVSRKVQSGVIGFYFSLLFGLLVQAGQIPGHDYTALRSSRYLSGPARKIVEDNMTAYLSGAQGPDICGVVMPKLDKGSAFTSVGEETHYSDRKAALALNLLDCARDDREKAYALGWMSHYINDIFVHSVVNDYGGFYEQFGKHHKELEQLETKHVFVKHADLVTQDWSNRIPATFGATFPEFIFDAYHKTFPDNPIYKSGDEWLVKNRPYFCWRYNEAASWCRAAGAKFYQSHVDGTGKHGYGVATLAFPNMPSTKEYDLMNKALEITEVLAEPERVRVTAKVNDSKLYGRFLVDWESNVESAIQYANQVFTYSSEYLMEKDPVKKKAMRQELLDVIPNQNLDQPHPSFDYKTAKPGDVDTMKLAYVMTLYQKVQEGKPAGKPVLVEGKASGISYQETNFAGSRSGEITFDITVPANSSPYVYRVQLALSDKEAFQRPEYRDVDWTQAEGTYPGTWMSGAGTVSVTDLFKVRMPIPERLAKNRTGARRWVIMPESSELKFEDLSMIKARFQQDKFRYDVEAIEEKIQGNELEATLQVTQTNPFYQPLLGRQKLVMIWFEDGKAETDLGGTLDDLNKQLAEAAKALDEANKTMDNLMTKEQEAQLESAMSKYAQELDKKGVSEAQKEKLMEQKALDEMKKMGIKPPKMDLDVKKVDDIMKLPFHVGTSIDLSGVELVCEPSTGWTLDKPSGNSKYQDSRYIGRKTSHKDEKDRLMWRLEGSLLVSCTTDEERIKAIKGRIVGKNASPMTVAGFTGSIIQSDQVTLNKPNYERGLSAEGLLKKGKVHLDITYSVSVEAFKIYEKNEKGDLVLVYDGRDDADKAVDSALPELLGMLRGIRLNQVR